MSDDISANKIAITLISPFEVKEGLKVRAKQCRLDANLTQSGLAKRADVSLGTLKHFERTGNASIEFLLAIAFALGAEKEFEALFPARPYKTIADVVEKKPRLRGRRQ